MGFIAHRLNDFQVYIGFETPSALTPPDVLPNTNLCYSHQVPAGAAEIFDVPCDDLGSVVSILLPAFSILTLCEVQVFGGI